VACWHEVEAALYNVKSVPGMFACLDDKTGSPRFPEGREGFWKAVQSGVVSEGSDGAPSDKRDDLMELAADGGAAAGFQNSEDQVQTESAAKHGGAATTVAAAGAPAARFTFLDPELLTHNKALYDKGHKEVRLRLDMCAALPTPVSAHLCC
jgi:general stress protein YciG